MSEIATAAGISFRLTDEQLELQRLAHEFAERELRPIAHEWDEREDFPRELLAKAASVGLTAGAIPREYGGSEVDAVTASLIAEELAWGCAGLSSTFGATSFPVRPLVRFGTEEQRQRYLPRLASEQGCLAAIAFTEPHAGSDVASIRSTATRDGDGFVLNGEKAYITNGGIAEITLVFAKLDGEITTFIAEESDEGIRLGRKDKKVGLRASHTGSVVLDNLRLPEDRLLGPPGQGFLIAMDFFEASRPQVAASALGVARAAFEYATEYARDREAFGRPLMDKQGVAFKLAEMAMTIEASRLLVWRAAAAVDAGEDAGLFGSYAKAMAADTAMRTATDAVQILGGAGIMREHPVEKWLRDAKVFQIVEGTSEIQRQIIATYLKHGWRERPR
jgi:alkylation response protein AidB-like acyl-CoA dehydrogenase